MAQPTPTVIAIFPASVACPTQKSPNSCVIRLHFQRKAKLTSSFWKLATNSDHLQYTSRFVIHTLHPILSSS